MYPLFGGEIPRVRAELPARSPFLRSVAGNTASPHLDEGSTVSEQENEQQQGESIPGHGSGEAGEGDTDRARQGEVEREGDLGRDSDQPADEQQAG